MEELHTIVDLSDPDEIRRDIDACATRWQREKPWITRTMHRTVRVGLQAPAMRASRQWAPVFLKTAGGTGVRGDAEQSPSIEDSRRRPRARSQRPRCSTGGSGTTCGTKDTRPSRATQLVRPPSVSPSVGLHMRSIVPSARAALGVLGHARSDVHELYQLPKSARPLHLHPCYDGAPVQDFAVCRLDADGSRALATLRWGLVPSWAKDLRRGARLVNARAETVHDTPSFSTAFRARRCLVPANGWFEWQRTGHAKQPYFLARADGSPLSFAARWECWNRGQASLASFTIITTAASPGLADIHHRQPVIVDPDRLTDWLDPSSPMPRLFELLCEPHAGPYERRAISTRVNSVGNDDADILTPVSETGLF